MKLSKKHLKPISVCLFELLAGLLVAIHSNGFIKSIVTVAGFGLILYGLLQVLRYYRADPVVAAKKKYLMKGLLTLSVGCFCAFRSNWFLAVLPSFSFLLGVGVFMVGLLKVQQAMDMARMDNPRWYLTFIDAAVSLACASMVLSGPNVVNLRIFTGILLILVAAADIAILVMHNVPQKPKSVEELPAEDIPAEEINL